MWVTHDDTFRLTTSRKYSTGSCKSARFWRRFKKWSQGSSITIKVQELLTFTMVCFALFGLLLRRSSASFGIPTPNKCSAAFRSAITTTTIWYGGQLLRAPLALFAQHNKKQFSVRKNVYFWGKIRSNDRQMSIEIMNKNILYISSTHYSSEH